MSRRLAHSSLERFSVRLGYETEGAMLYHFPRRYEDRARWVDPFSVEEGEEATVFGKVAAVKFSRWRGGRSCFEVTLQPEGTYQALRVLWYGMPYLKNSLREGRSIVLHGKVTGSKKGRQMQHPDFELISSDDPDTARVHLNRITPVYPLTEGVSQRALRREMYRLVMETPLEVEELYEVPSGFPSREEALREVHFPSSWETLEAARKRLVFEEFFGMQVVLAMRRCSVAVETKKRSKPDCELVSPFLESLPFPLTGAQQRVCREIDADLAKGSPMNRLLQGDVGSGKTFVAMHALLRTLESGKNGAMLAPTEILAEQHSLNLKKWLEPLGVQVELWTRSHKPSQGESLFGQKGKIFVGTHALIQESVDLPELGLGVIDEQHKFGVLQRAALCRKGESPDLLVMTATPIPRTLCLTLYGDLDVSVLDELPPGRQPIRTVVRKEEALPKVWDFIKKEMEEGRQAYVVYPLVEESAKMDLKSVEKEAKKLREIFGEERVAVLHGRMDAAKKEEVMRRFRGGEFGVLVATTVIEVGVDVPNATTMVIEHAERFGLAQLHQLRGRVGRGEGRSYCVLVGKAQSVESWRRLKVMEETSDGFRIAEEDLKIRGPGNVIGTEQSGLPPLKLANWNHDMALLHQARQAASELVEADPSLRRHRALREVLITYFPAGMVAAVN